MNNHKSEKKIMWYSLAFMAFSTVWGFGNVINGFSEYGGLKAIVSWALIFAIYFVPYALMVGEMGSAFKEAGGGVSSWILETIGPRMLIWQDGPTGLCICHIFHRNQTAQLLQQAGQSSEMHVSVRWM